ncbi:BOS1-like vesicular transport protein [Nosema bombycis CQ1]|uniref:BOS1-like vesicular transport protein n=1 Tax=Nosema bombycis (strain CQ1 / CVCC 102059) TaxID=578461 RepID=R0KT90_NOSB1|nr:BOS1-like vesicular transport protein [Nosema bombycis CQ1]|eukprot:EOB13437.1 BOS1-like vesicular transport protein [Nosema bombycis CQ1]
MKSDESQKSLNSEKIENDLRKESEEIETELKKAEENFEGFGSLAIKIQAFIKKVEQLTTKNEELETKAAFFNKEIIRLSNLRMNRRRELDDEMERSNLKPPADFTEFSETATKPLSDSDFFLQKTQRVNKILVNAIDVFESVKRQGKYIERTNSKIKSGLLKIGLSRQLVEEIDRRYLADKNIFVIGFVLIIIIFFLFRFMLK